MRVFRVMSKADREVSETRARTQSHLRTLTDVDKIVKAKAAMRPIQTIRSSKVISPAEAKRQYDRNRTLEYTVSREDRGSKVPRVQLGGRPPRRTFDSPAGYPHRTALQTVREYSGRSRK